MKPSKWSDRRFIQYLPWVFMTSITALPPNLAAAEAVVAIVKRQMTKGENVSYLAKDGADQGYIAISARLKSSAVDKAVCVTPTNPTGGSDNYFVKGNLEINITAVVEGFGFIDRDQQIPIATFNFKDSEDGGKYCMTPFSLPITLVPNHPFEKYGGIGGREPKITFNVSSTSKQEERVSKLVVGWLQIAGAVATGGAASTVVGLANIASGKAVTTLSDLYSKRNKSIADLAVSVEKEDGMTWANLATGISTMRISLIESTTQKRGTWSSESLKEAITRINQSPDAPSNTALLDIELTFEYRRSLFIDDKEFILKSLGMYPKNNDDDRLRPYSVLNYPRSSGDPRSKDAPTLVQQINKLAPSLSSTIAKDATGCTQLLATLRGLGLNSPDRAIAVKAVLDDAKPNWNQDSTFFNSCLGTDAEVPKHLSAMYDKSPTPFLMRTISVQDPDQLLPQSSADNLRPISPDILPRVRAIQMALSPGYQRHVKRQQIISAFFPGGVPQDPQPFAWRGRPLLNALKDGEVATFDRQIDILADLAINSASCIYSEVNNPNIPHFFVLLEKPTDTGTSKQPNLVTVELDPASPHNLKSIVIDGSPSHLDYVKDVIAQRSTPPAACKALLNS